MYKPMTQSAAAPPPAVPSPAATSVPCDAPQAQAYVRVLTRMFANLVWLR